MPICGIQQMGKKKRPLVGAFFKKFLRNGLHRPVFQLLARFKPRDLARLDVDYCTGLRVATCAGAALRNVERTKIRQRDLVSLAKALSDIVRQRVENLFGCCLGDFAILGYVID